MLIFVVIAFMVLLKDIAADIVDYLCLFLQSNNSYENLNYGQLYKSQILIVLIVLVYPLMIQKSLYALRYVSYMGTASVLLLLIIIIIKSIHVNYADPSIFTLNARWYPESITDVIYSLPIILIAFLCQFNVLGVYSNVSYDYFCVDELSYES